MMIPIKSDFKDTNRIRQVFWFLHLSLENLESAITDFVELCLIVVDLKKSGIVEPEQIRETMKDKVEKFESKYSV